MDLCPWLMGLFQEGDLFSSAFSLTGPPPLMMWLLVGVAPRQVSTRAGRSPERTRRLPRPHAGRHPKAPCRRSSLLPEYGAAQAKLISCYDSHAGLHSTPLWSPFAGGWHSSTLVSYETPAATEGHLLE